MKKKIRLGVNIDHIATLRNARNELKMAGIRKKVAEEKRKEDDEN